MLNRTIMPAFALLAVALLSPSAAFAGDEPYVVVHDWVVGKIDGHVMFYLGRNHFLDTPVPAPPEGPRWDFAYDVLLRCSPPALVVVAAYWFYQRGRRGRLEPPAERVS